MWGFPVFLHLISKRNISSVAQNKRVTRGGRSALANCDGHFNEWLMQWSDSCWQMKVWLASDWWTCPGWSRVWGHALCPAHGLLSEERAHQMSGVFTWKHLSTWISKISVRLRAIWSILLSGPRDGTCSRLHFRAESAGGASQGRLSCWI